MTTARRNSTAFSAPAYFLRAVRKLIKPGYTHRFAVNTLNQSAGSAINNIPNLASTVPLDTGSAAINTRPTLVTYNAKLQLANSVSPQVISAVLPASIPQPFTVVYVGRSNVASAGILWTATDGTGTNGATNMTRMGSTAAVFEMDNASVTILHTKAVDTLPHIMVGVFNGANSVLAIDNVEVSGPVGTIPLAVNLQTARLGTSGPIYTSALGDWAVYPFAFNQADRSATYAHLKAEYGL